MAERPPVDRRINFAWVRTCRGKCGREQFYEEFPRIRIARRQFSRSHICRTCDPHQENRHKHKGRLGEKAQAKQSEGPLASPEDPYAPS